ncbi:MAG: type II toxin-antitoxin system HipA family toxin [Gammaproteobacteria bacterium]|nr:type II toxin-antitoxin system HipA family toxin [Gammaproteobacteria bacterium]
MSADLYAIANGAAVGAISRDRRGRLSFAYDHAWRTHPDAFPLSMCMPLISGLHPHARVHPWLWGLLPNNEAILGRWAQRFFVSPDDPIGLLGAVGEDCAGAVHFTNGAPRTDGEQTPPRDERPRTKWLSDAEVAERLRALRRDKAAWRDGRDPGQFTLAGAQPKIAILVHGERCAIPVGHIPTTHILKPDTAFAGHAVNEHICLQLARRMGLPAAHSQVRSFEELTTLVVERYDRVRSPEGEIRRLHQEDLCQMLAHAPNKKYENGGGPSSARMMEAIRTYSTEPQSDAWTFAKAMIFNWLIAGTNARAKNFSMLIGGQSRVRLAPLYDLASTLPYGLEQAKLRLATPIGDTDRLAEVGPEHWRKFANEVRLPARAVRDTCVEMATGLPEALSEVASRAEPHPIVEQMVDRLGARAKACAALF